MRKLIILFLFFVVFPKQQFFAASLYFRELKELSETQQFAEKLYTVLTALNFYKKGERVSANKSNLENIVKNDKVINYVLEYFSHYTPTDIVQEDGPINLIDKYYEKRISKGYFDESEFGKDRKKIGRIKKLLLKLYKEGDWKYWVPKNKVGKMIEISEFNKKCKYKDVLKRWKKFTSAKQKYKRAKTKYFGEDHRFRTDAIKYRIKEQQKPPKRATTRRG